MPSLLPERRQALRRLAQRCAGLVMLAGNVRRTGLSQGAHRSLLDLPLEPGHTILQQWQDQARVLVSVLEQEQLPIRVVISSHLTPPASVAGHDERVPVQIQRDPLEYRGTGGVLRDLSEEYAAEDYLLVATGAQVLVDSLVPAVESLASAEGDVVMLAEESNQLSGLMLIRCGSLRRIPTCGFVDLKEQAIARMALQSTVRVARSRRTLSLPVRTLPSYIGALQRYHEVRCRPQTGAAPAYAERWESTFSVIEEGARVESGAQIHDSVVLRGGYVERDAWVVRSLVCPGGAIRIGEVFVDQLVTPWSRV